MRKYTHTHTTQHHTPTEWFQQLGRSSSSESPYQRNRAVQPGVGGAFTPMSSMSRSTDPYLAAAGVKVYPQSGYGYSGAPSPSNTAQSRAGFKVVPPGAAVPSSTSAKKPPMPPTSPTSMWGRPSGPTATATATQPASPFTSLAHTPNQSVQKQQSVGGANTLRSKPPVPPMPPSMPGPRFF
jgi:hypothetical protein